jgi:DNA-binding protein H-NS/GNAT superfamily N-acetyltransferase
MPYSIQLPDGSLVENIPDEITPREAKARIIKAYPQYAPESGDVFVPALKSGFSGVQEAGYALAGRTGLMDEAAAQKAIEEEQAYQRRVFKPTEEGFLEAPVTKTLELLGGSLPYMALPVAAAGAALTLPVTGPAATVAALGAAGLASGAQFTGTNLLRQMEPTDEAPQGKSIGETDLGDAALAAVPQAALDVLSLRMMPFIRGVFGQVGKDLSEEAARRIASKNLKDVAADYALATGKTMTVEGLTEAAQQSLERLQAGLTMTDEAARDEYLESFIGGAVLGGVLAPPGRYLERRAAQKEVPPETKPEPTATQPTAPTPITDEDELTPEEEADLQARIAAAPPAAGLPVAATPTQPLAPPAPVQQVTASPEAVALPGTQQLTPQAAPELEVLTAQLARIQQARMDPTLSPDDPAFLEFDQQEAAIQARIQQLTAPPAAVTQPPAQPLAPPVAPVVEPEVIPEEAVVEAPVVTPPQIQGPRFGLSSVLDSPAQPLAPEITPPADVESVVTPAVEEPVIEEPVARPKDEVQAEINRVRQSMKKAQTAVKKGQLPEAEVTKLQERMTALEAELDAAKAGKRKPKYRSAEGNTWIGTGATPGWLNKKLEAGFDLSDFEIRPELGDKSEVEVELEKPPGFGRPMPATRPTPEYERVATRLEAAETATPNLFSAITGKLSSEDVVDIGTGPDFAFLRAGKGKGKPLSELISDGELDDYLPEGMRPESRTFDAAESSEYLKDLLRQDPATDPESRLTYEAREFLIPMLRNELDQLAAELEPEDVNQLIQEIVAEERAAIADLEAGAIAEQERGPGVPGVTPDFALTGQTPEELAELQRKELSGEAEAERDRIEAEEAARAAAEAEARSLIRSVRHSSLAPTSQRTRNSRQQARSGISLGPLALGSNLLVHHVKVAAEPSPIEKLAAEKAPTLEDETTERMRQLGVLDFDDASQKVQEAYGVSKPVADAYVRSVRKEAEEIAKSTFGMENEFQKAYDESTKLRNRMEGIRRRKKDKIIEKIQEAPQLQYAQDALAEYIARFTDKLPSTGQRSYDAQTNTITDVVNAKDDVTMPRADFDALVSIAKTLDSAAGKNYSIVVEDTPEKSSIFTFRPRSLKATDTQVNVFAQLEETNRYVEELTLDEQIKKSLKDFGLDDRAKASKKRQEEFGISKPVADALVRADIERMEMSAKFEYGVATEAEYKAASKKYYDLLNKAEAILKQKKAAEKDKPSIRKTREVAEGTVVERIELPDNIEIRIVKLKDGYSVYQYDLDSDQIVMGQQNQFRSPAFKNDQDAYQAAEAFASDMFDKVVPKMAGEMQAAMKERLSRGEDVVNNKTPDPDIPADQRLVLMACCATKKKGMGMGPAIEVYTGVFFQTLKNKLKEGAMPNLRILSAKYGFIAPDQKIEVYDQVMDKSSADGFMLDDKLVEGFPSNIKDVLIVGSDQYQRVMKAAIEDLIKAGKIDKGASINVTKGGIGEQRAQLGRYLASLPVKKEPEGKRAAKTPLAFYQQMIPDAGFKRLDLDDPRTYKNKSGEEFLTFERDGVRVAVKSNTQLYAADRGVGMYMGEDNDLLIQAMIVDESARRQGKATKALQDILSMADQAGMTSYIEPVQMTKDVGMTTEQLKDFYKQFGFKPQKTEPATDRVMVREPGAKIEIKKEDKPRATTAGMTITEIMAETERVKKQLAEMGMDPDVTYRPEDTSKEKREAKEAKRRIELTRLAGESSRIDKLTREPIIGNPGQRSAAERLARSVDGELLFLDGSRGLGIVFAKDREGNDAYLPIHAGKISRVDVRDFTGLKSTDQAYLKRVRSELVRDAGVRQKRKDDDADMEFMLKGTEDQQKGVRAVARQVGGQPVYFDPETNIGLVRGYGEEAGTPIYAVTMGNRYSENDVEVTTATPFLPYKAKLIEIKNQLEKEAEQKHKDDPFITFENGIAMSSDIDQSTGEIFKEWKSMLGLGNVNIYLSTFEDAKKNVDNFTGPHRVIGSGLLKSLTGGRMRRMPDGSYFILFEKSTSKTAVLEMLAHELGHVHEREAYNNAPQELKDKLKEAYEKWVTQRQGKTAREAIEMLRAKTTAQTTKIGADITTVRELDRADPRRYWSSFSEWYADQVSRWAVTDEKPVGVVEKFFARLGAALRRFYQTLKGQKYLPDETFVQYLKQVKPVIVEEIPWAH